MNFDFDLRLVQLSQKSILIKKKKYEMKIHKS